ncbi:unnamed protein product [Lactuca virosa]|uniref:Uncharacterized protein n=1 Tax=Lactuca virosa TaxID=75947 RepID=A0AAU9NGV8_9ASTR|nr:unnamed protein product [Lactuca virosa]
MGGKVEDVVYDRGSEASKTCMCPDDTGSNATIRYLRNEGKYSGKIEQPSTHRLKSHPNLFDSDLHYYTRTTQTPFVPSDAPPIDAPIDYAITASFVCLIAD